MDTSILMLNVVLTYYPLSDSCRMTLVGKEIPLSVEEPTREIHHKALELLSGSGTPALVATPLIRDALIAWQKAIYSHNPF